MQKKLLAVAVAGALGAPTVALAQSSVTISGSLNLWYESVSGTGATNQASATATTFDLKRRDRVQDGAGSNIRFTVVEDLGGGMQAFGQVESAVFNNADTRNNNFGAGAGTGGWANRNSGVGLRGKVWGEILLGIWDIHYTESYAVDSQILTGPSHSSSLGLLGTFGTPGWSTAFNPSIGNRLSNVIRYASPNWGGFTFNMAYSRPTDAVVSTSATGGAANPIEGKKNTVLNFAPKFNLGGLHVGYSWYRDKDATVANVAGVAAPSGTGTATITPAVGFFSGAGAGAAAVGANSGAAGTALTANGSVLGGVNKITSNRFQAAYTFPFGLKIGGIFDKSKWEMVANTTSVSTPAVPIPGLKSTLKRDVWAIPLSYNIGAHTAFFTFARATKLKGDVGGVDLGEITVTPNGGTAQSFGDNTGAKFLSIGYQFALSKRTNIHLNHSRINNDSLAGYDFFSNTIGMANGNFGADPKTYSIGLRHTF